MKGTSIRKPLIRGLTALFAVFILLDIFTVPIQTLAAEAYERPAKPVITAVKPSAGEITITWKKVKDAEKYRVFRREKSESKFRKLAFTTSRKYTDKTVVPGKRYEYRVRAYAKTADGYISGKASDIVTGVTNRPPTVRITNVSERESYILLGWNASVKAQGYQVFRSKTGKSGSFKRIAVTAKTTYKDTKLKKNQTYFYLIRAYRKANGKTYYSGFSGKKSGKLLVHKICPDCGRILVNPSGANWNLVVVNAGREMPAGYQPKLKEILSSGKYLDYRVAPYYEKMYYAAKKDGIILTPYSAYRTYERQKTNYNNLINQYMRQYGLSREAATKKAATVILPPGTSEHNLGLAVDICNTKSSFAYSREYAWLQKHAHEYGFILRYTKEKQPITGIIPEPWHWRYVGVGYAKKIRDSGLCLEEYLTSVDIPY